MSTNDEQYRAGFEAWMKTRPGYPFAGAFANMMWESWLASKRNASTEPSALVEALRAALRSVNAVAIERGDKYGACDQIDNAGNPYQSEWFAKLLADQSAGALPDEGDEAKDAARYRFLCDDSTKMDGNFMIEHRASSESDFDVLVMKFVIDSILDAAIAQSKAGKEQA